ncbi:hypothetical protein OC846_006115 [Tilletia horrida]|uniref:Uncharacterized protein n=1 Tax=Tilletia horrida TaxID=155126 RepID=A0AAN6GM97_9BASI|nr:hypothetical protein OC846_006115 [Tilletia horrida]KAK0553176.1 hypothetical protein OC845_001312 [Tilletia horrida]
MQQRAVDNNNNDYCSFYGCGLGVGARAGIIAGIIVCVLILATLVAGIRRRRIQRMHDTIYMQQSYSGQPGTGAAGNPYAAYPPNQRQNQWYAGPPPGTPPAEDAPYVPPYGYKPEGNTGTANPYYNPPQGPPPGTTSNSYAPPTSPPPGEPVASPNATATQHAAGTGENSTSAPTGATSSFPSMPEPVVHASHTGGGSLQHQNTGAPSVVPSVPPPAYDSTTSNAPRTTTNI